MTRSPLDFDISVSGAKKRKSRKRGVSGEVSEANRKCDWQNCDKPGKYRAPKSRDSLNDYYWFCMDHIREYNSNWDYYSGMDPSQIDVSKKKDQLWGRPTWRLDGKNPIPDDPERSSHAEGQAWRRFGYEDPMEVLGENATINPGSAAHDEAVRARRRVLPKADRKALETLGLDELATFQDIRIRYKELVKQLHPDMNGGDRTEEGRLKHVLAAWTILKNSTSFK